MKNIYYFSVSLSPLNDYWILDLLLSEGIEVKIIDIYSLVNDASIDITVDNSQVNYHATCNSSFELDELLEKINADDLVFAPTGAGVSEYIRNILAMKSAKIICDTTFSLPIISLDMNLQGNKYYANPLNKIFRVYRSKGFTGLIKHCIDFITCKMPISLEIKKKVDQSIDLSKVRKNTYLITSGSMNHLSYKHVNNAYNQVKIAHYCVVCREKKLEPVIDGPYWVFIDQALPFHRDAKRIGIDYARYASEYYQSLLEFFKNLELTTGKNVVIAIHPRTNSEYSEYFKSFKTFKGVTEELIQYSDGVLSHFSTCIYSAVYLRKPVTIITNDLMDMHHDVRRMHDFSNRLNKKIIRIEKFNPSDIKSLLEIDLEKYQTFQEDYIQQIDAKEDKAINILKDKFGI